MLTEETIMNSKYLYKVLEPKTVIFRMLCLLVGLCLWLPGAHAQLLGDGNPARGTGVFEGLGEAPGRISVVSPPKPQHALVFRYDTWDDPTFATEREESKGARPPRG